MCMRKHTYAGTYTHPSWLTYWKEGCIPQKAIVLDCSCPCFPYVILFQHLTVFFFFFPFHLLVLDTFLHCFPFFSWTWWWLCLLRYEFSTHPGCIWSFLSGTSYFWPLKQVVSPNLSLVYLASSPARAPSETEPWEGVRSLHKLCKVLSLQGWYYHYKQKGHYPKIFKKLHLNTGENKRNVQHIVNYRLQTLLSTTWDQA